MVWPVFLVEDLAGVLESLSGYSDGRCEKVKKHEIEENDQKHGQNG